MGCVYYFILFNLTTFQDTTTMPEWLRKQSLNVWILILGCLECSSKIVKQSRVAKLVNELIFGHPGQPEADLQ